MRKSIIKTLEKRFYGIYEANGQDALIDAVNKYNETSIKPIPFEHCKACEAEMPSINHSCLACGQHTKVEPEWVLTDADTNQYGRQLTDVLFEFKEDGRELPEGIDLNGYTNGQIESCINSYGYTLFKAKDGLLNVHDHYGKDANWIIAECIFETDL